MKKQHALPLPCLLLLMSLPLVNGECMPTDSVCEYNMTVFTRSTMTDGSYRFAYLHNGSLYRPDVTDPDPSLALPVDDVVTADGFARPNSVITINGQMPGPAIYVYEGQKVKVMVSNRLRGGESISIHWHGIKQRETPYMDGAAYITQCSISPYMNFVYEFVPDKAGTYFYHSHIGMLSTIGLYGPLIVKERPTSTPPMDEHIVMIAEYSHDRRYDMRPLNDYFEDELSIDGRELSYIEVHSILINGRGRYTDDAGVSTNAPLTVYDVTPGQQYRFRVIGAGHAHAFRVSVDNHMLLLVAVDGRDIEPLEVQSFMINEGERFDFILTADQPVGNYLFRARTIEERYHLGEAIIRYTGVSEEYPTSQPHSCTADNICTIANCVFPEYPGEEHSNCLDPMDLNAKNGEDAIGKYLADSEIHELFFNFNSGRGPSVNSKRMVLYPVNALYQSSEIPTFCRPDVCNPHCFCTHSVTINKNDIVQLNLISYHGRDLNLHSIHQHGHHFQVLKIGHYIQNQTTRQYEGTNTVVHCNSPDCDVPSWTNSSWRGNSIPGLKMAKPLLKDTVSVNAGGYAVVRFRADNPGLWMLHCHTNLHVTLGMAVVLNVSLADVPAPPEGFPECRSFYGARPSPLVNQTSSTPQPMCNDVTTQKPLVEEKADTVSSDKHWTTVGILIGCVVVEFLLLVYCCYQRMSGSTNTEKYVVNGKPKL